MVSKRIAAEEPADTWDVVVVLDASGVSQNALSEFFESIDYERGVWVARGVAGKISAKMELLSAGEFEPDATVMGQSLCYLDLLQAEYPSVKLARLGQPAQPDGYCHAIDR